MMGTVIIAVHLTENKTLQIPSNEEFAFKQDVERQRIHTYPRNTSYVR